MPYDRKLAESPGPSRRTSWRHFAFLAFAFLLCSFELWIVVEDPQSSSTQFLWIVAVAACLASAAWFPAVAGSAVIGLVTVAQLFPSSTVDLGLLFLGVFAVVLDWIARGWWVAAVLALCVPQITQLSTSQHFAADIFGVVLGSFFAIIGGLAVRHFENRNRILEQERTTAEEALEAAERAQEQIRREVASTLHDTLAADLVRMSMSSHSLAMRSKDSEVAALARELEESSRSTLRDLRAVIAAARSQQRNEHIQSTGEVTQTCRDMLAGRNIEFEVDIPEGLDEKCSIDLRKNLSLVIQEGAVNILKYAKAGSQATLSVQMSVGGDVDLMLVNERGNDLPEDGGALSGGFGLESLQARIASSGGFLQVSRRESRWIMVAHLVEPAKERI
ncbi:histidine kinase [Actinomycetaceae bacterium L2_0104]